MGDFDRDTDVRPLGDGAYDGAVSDDWFVATGPNGGYVAAIVMRALVAEVADPERPPRSLTIQYLRAPAAGPVRVDVVVERAGRNVSFLTSRLTQGDRPCAIAVAVFARSGEGMSFDDVAAPAVPAPEEVPEPPERVPEGPPFGRHFHYRPAIGARLFSGADRALSGGWLRLRDDSPLDPPRLAAYCDSWFPAAFARATAPFPAPTLDLTVHFRDPAPRPADFVLIRVETTLARDGLMEEDAEVYDRDGRLLVQSRQLALTR